MRVLGVAQTEVASLLQSLISDFRASQ